MCPGHHLEGWGRQIGCNGKKIGLSLLSICTVVCRKWGFVGNECCCAFENRVENEGVLWRFLGGFAKNNKSLSKNVFVFFFFFFRSQPKDELFSQAPFFTNCPWCHKMLDMPLLQIFYYIKTSLSFKCFF